jgi:hypothetical protein
MHDLTGRIFGENKVKEVLLTKAIEAVKILALIVRATSTMKHMQGDCKSWKTRHIYMSWRA